MNDKLTIAIPTYNRRNQLKKTLFALDNQTNKNFCLVISDNCSDYDVFDILDEISEELRDKIEIVRNAINIGATGNICNLFLHSKTKWIWTVGDDDTIYGDAVEKIYSYIEKYSDCAYIEFPVFNDMSLVQKDIVFKGLEELVDFFYTNYKRINVTAFGEIAFVGNKIFNFDMLEKVLVTMYERNYVKMSTGLLMLKLADLHYTGILASSKIIAHGQDEKMQNTWNYLDVCQGNRIFQDVGFDISDISLKKLLFILLPPEIELFRGCRQERYSKENYLMLRNLYFEVYSKACSIKKRIKFKIFMFFQRNEILHKFFYNVYGIYLTWRVKDEN